VDARIPYLKLFFAVICREMYVLAVLGLSCSMNQL